MTNRWYLILDSKEVPKNRPHRVKRLGHWISLWRDATGSIHAIADRCCHRGASLGSGFCQGDSLCCPFHGFEYNGDGKVVTIPANGKATPVDARYHVPSYLVKEAHGFIWLWWGTPDLATEEIPFFDSLKTGFSYQTLWDTWDVHYSRAIENQLDVVHLPFVHKTTIGKGNKTVVDGPVVHREGDLMTIYVHNQVDDGQIKPKRASEITDYQDTFQLQFLFPNIWQNLIHPKIRVFAGFAPVDEVQTVVYIRYYQALTQIPLIKNLILLSGKWYSKVILNQDKRVVLTQIPPTTQWVMDEKLIPGDSPILEFRKYRAETFENQSLEHK